MAGLADELREIHAGELGRPHPRDEPRAAELRADALNNRALSLLDLGRQSEAEECWAKALDADPQHLLVAYNRGLVRWRAGEETDRDLVGRLAAAAAETWEAAHLLAQVHLERGDAGAALGLLDTLPARAGRVEAVARTRRAALALDGVRCRRVVRDELAPARAGALSGDGSLVLAAGATSGALRLLDTRSGSWLRTLEGHDTG